MVELVSRKVSIFPLLSSSTPHCSTYGYRAICLPPIRINIHVASLHLHSSFYLICTIPTSKNLLLSIKTSDASPSIQKTPLPLRLPRAVWPQELVPLPHNWLSLRTWTNLFHQNYSSSFIFFLSPSSHSITSSPYCLNKYICMKCYFSQSVP